MKKLLLVLSSAFLLSQTADAQMNFGMKIGETYYGQQEANSAGKRIARKSNGAVSVVWSESCVQEPIACPTCPYDNAGPGYNHFGATGWVHGTDGTCDEPGAAHGIFTQRALSPELLVFPSGRELVIAHGASGLISSSRSQAGVGGMAGWSGSQQISPAGAIGNAWPQVASSGSFVHLVATCNSCTGTNGVVNPIRYYRSADEGQTWNITDVDLPGADAASFQAIGTGNYAISAYGSTVAIVAGIAIPGSQWAMWKSVDNGDTWTKTVLREFSLADTVTSLPCPNVHNYLGHQLEQHALYESNDKHHSVLVDQSGNVHAWSGYMLTGIDRAAPQFAQPLHMLSEGLWYWTETMAAPSLVVNQREDAYTNVENNWIANGQFVNPAATSPYMYTGLLSMPTAALAANGDIYVVYSGIVESTSSSGDSTGQSFRDLYLMRRSAQGIWSPPVNLILATTGSRTDFIEEVYPSVIPVIGNHNYLYLTFQADDEPGTRFTEEMDYETLNEIRFAVINVIPPISVVNPPLVAAPEELAAQAGIEVVPNPSPGNTAVQLNLLSAAIVSVSVTDLLGREILNLPAQALPAGEGQLLELNLSGEPGGVYVCTVLVNGVPKTTKLIKE